MAVRQKKEKREEYKKERVMKGGEQGEGTRGEGSEGILMLQSLQVKSEVNSDLPFLQKVSLFLPVGMS